MAEDSMFLSDVHISTLNQTKTTADVAETVFQFKLHREDNTSKPCKFDPSYDDSPLDEDTFTEVQYDEDGDLIIDRRLSVNTSHCVLTNCQCCNTNNTHTAFINRDHLYNTPSEDVNSTCCESSVIIQNCEGGKNRLHETTEHSQVENCIKENDNFKTVVGEKLRKSEMTNETESPEEVRKNNKRLIEEVVDIKKDEENQEISKKRARIESALHERNNDDYSIVIKHSMATDLQSVGEQVWQGALLLCDYIIHCAKEFKEKGVVDLGAGTGLTSIVAALFGSSVYCTDTGNRILALAEQNVRQACSSGSLASRLCPVAVKDLDWFQGLTASNGVYGLTAVDIENIWKSDIIIAADVVYDLDITDAFFNVVKALLQEKPSKTVYIGMEKRLVFTLEDLDVTSPGYNHFRDHLAALSLPGSKRQCHVEQISTDFPLYFQYHRTPQLELWKITAQQIAA